MFKKVLFILFMFTLFIPQELCAESVRGDVNQDGNFNIADVTDLIDCIISSGETPISLEAADMDGDGSIGIADVVLLIDLLIDTHSTVSSSVDSIAPVSTTADITCSFRNIPANAQCGVIVHEKGSNTDGKIYYGNPKNGSQTIKVTNLSVNTTYTATAFASINGYKYEGIDTQEFTTNTPSGIIQSIDDVTVISAVANCQFNDIDSGVECGIIAKASRDTLIYITTSSDNEQSMLMNGLTPCLIYKCFAYIKTADYYQEQKTGITIQPIPDFLGAWHCTEIKEDGSRTETTKLVFYPNGKVTSTATGDSNWLYYETSTGSWTVKEDQTISIGFNEAYGNYSPQYVSKGFRGYFDNLLSPFKISGSVTWSRAGWSGQQWDSYYTFVMERETL